MKKIFPLIILFGIVLRVLISISTYHQDLGAIALSGKYIVVENRWLNFYEMSGKDKSETIFNYQPLAYLIPSSIYLPFKSILKGTAENYINSDWTKSYLGSFNPELLLYKLPMLLADIGILLLIGKFFKNESTKQVAQIFWSLNPLAVYVSSVLGQVDIIIAFFILLALYFYRVKKTYMALFFISLSALIKPIGLVLLPLFSFNSIDIKIAFKSLPKLFFGIGIYALGILPFMSLPSYRYYALFADQINKSTFSGISIASGNVIPWFFVLYCFVILSFLNKRLSLLVAVILSLLSSLIFSHFHPQWMVWVMPLLILLGLEKEKISYYFLSVFSWALVLFSFDNSLHLGVFWHNQLALPVSIFSSSFFKQIVQMARALLVANFLWMLTSEIKNHD